MELRKARLCLDCEEVHDVQRCPVCASDMFTPIARWVPAEERRQRPRTVPPEAEVYRQLTGVEVTPPSRVGRLFKHGIVGLAAVGLAGWFWRSHSRPTKPVADPGT